MHKIVMLLFLLVAFSQGYSQEDEPDPSLDKIYDRDGKEYTLAQLRIEDRGRAQKKASLVTCSSTSYFNLYFDIGSGMENTADAVHNARRAVVCKVFEDLSNFINSPLTANGNKVNIWVRNIADTDAPAGVLGLASSFYISPSGGSIPTGGILDGEIWKTIHLGTDSYTNITTSTVNFYHGQIAFNFTNPAIQWHTNLASNAPSTLYDLYTVVLHEVTHALGFNSFINQNGASLTGAGYYSRYDTFLRTNANVPLLTQGSCTMYNLSFNPAVSPSVLRPGCTLPGNVSNGSLNTTVCNSAIKFVGSTITVPVYTPTCFEPGSSLSHFEDMLYPSCASPNGNDSYFVVSNSIAKGVTKRYLKTEERRTMCDLGYSVKTVYGATTTSNGYFNYGGTACGGIAVAGLSDGLNPDGSYTFMGTIAATGGTSTTVAITGLLSNDVNATSFECLQDITAVATFSATAGTAGTTVNFTTTTGGLHLLRYVPVNGTQRGNITYVYVYIIPPPIAGSCSPTPSACDLVMNGDFEQYSTLPTNASQIRKACGWNSPKPQTQYTAAYFNSLVQPGSNSSFWPGTPCNQYGYQAPNNNIGNAYAGITARYHSGKRHLYTTLKSPLLPNTTYQLSFDVSLADATDAYATKLQAYLSSTEVLAVNLDSDVVISNPANLLTSPTITRNVTGWDTITFTFTTTTGGQRFLYLGMLNNSELATNTPSSNTSGCNYNLDNLTAEQYLAANPLAVPVEAFFNYSRGYYIDNVSLIPTNGAALELPTAICNAQLLNDLRTYVSGAATDGVFSGPGVTEANGIYSFNAATAGVGIITIGYTYTNSAGCEVTLYDTINVTTTASNSNTADALNDSFPGIMVTNATSAVTASVYANDTYNGTLSTPASLPNVSFTLVAPVAIAGASIDGTGAITVPAATPSGTYTLTYSLKVVGNCSFSDTATVLITVQNTSPAPNIGADGEVYATLVQPNGYIIIGGNFSTYNNIPRNKIARLKPDLTLDTTFDPANVGFNDSVFALALQGSSIIVGGFFTATGTGQAKKNLARMTSAGIIDNTFANNNFQPLSGASYVKSLAVDGNGRILVGGIFATVNSYPGTAKNGITRLQSNGSPDNTFVSQLLEDSGVVNAIEVLSDQTILIGGQYLRLLSGPVILYKAIPSTGALETNFTLGKCYASPTNLNISTMSVKDIEQKNGKLLVAGYFNSYNQTGQNNLVQISTVGVPDASSTFNSGLSSNAAINTVVGDPVTSRIIIGGDFSSYNGNVANRIARLTPSGGFDGSFAIGTGFYSPAAGNTRVNCLKIIPNGTSAGKILVGGYFTQFNGIQANYITRLLQTSPVVQGRMNLPAKNGGAEVRIYPNPSEGIFNIDFKGYDEQKFDMAIHNTLGQLIYHGVITPENTSQIDLTLFESGSYFITLQNGTETINKIVFKK